MKKPSLKTVLNITTLALAAAILYWSYYQEKECKDKGGALVRGLWSPECVKVQRLK